MSEKDEDIIKAAIDFQKRSMEAESENRRNAVVALRFRHGEQWPPEIIQSRMLQQRPCQTINKLDAYCLQVSNQQRQQRPRIKVDPTNNEATKKKADIIKGMIRHIESTDGGGDLAYDTGFNSAITAGWGYWRVLTRYENDKSFDQELYLAPIDNLLSCYGDPNSTMPEGSDMQEFLIVDDMPKAQFRKEYPGLNDGANFTPAGSGDSVADWVTRDNIRVAEYLRIKRIKTELLRMPDGTSAWADEVPEELASIITSSDRRPVMKPQVQWFKLTAMDIAERRDLPGKYIPIVKISGKVEVIENKRWYSGLVKNAMDPQRGVNYWNTAATESIAMAAKAKWLIAEGQDEGHEGEWTNANISATATLRYKSTDVDGKPAPPPERIQPEPPPAGILALLQQADQNLTSVLGIVDPAMRIGGNVSGKALQSERLQSDNGNFHYYDEMTRSIAFTGRILLDLMPHYYSGPRMVRIIGDDGRATLQAINDVIENNIAVGSYDVVMDTGPGYSTKRQEAVDSMMPLMQGNEELFNKAGDLVFRNMDFPGAETIADRLAASNPLAQINEQSEVPPAAQMKIKQQEQVIQQQTQQLQAMELEIKHRAGIEQMKDEGATKREMIKATSAIHVEDQENRAWMHDVAVKAQASLSVAEINAFASLLKTKITHQHEVEQLGRTAAHEDAQLERQQKQPEESV